MIRVLIAGVLMTLCGCAGSLGERVHESFHQAVESGAAPSVRVDNVAGAVEIEPWSRASVDIAATKYGYDADELRSVTIDVRRDGNAISVETKYAGGDHSGGVRYRLTVPQDASVTVNNVAGSVTVGAVAGNVSVETQAGTVVARLGRVDGDRAIDLQATTGTVTLWMARDSSASVEAQSTVGNFSSDFPGISASRENVVGAAASGKLGSGTGRIRLTTTTGAISLRSTP
jgi:DUF4097 and DUF4098 domain-containing protein YvlB